MNKAIINYYLDTVTVGYFNDHDLPPDDISSYEELVQTIRQKAVKHGDIADLHIALAWLLDSDGVDLELYNGGRYPFNACEMLEIISYIYNVIFSEWEKPPQEILAKAELCNVPLEYWWQRGKRIDASF